VEAPANPPAPKLAQKDKLYFKVSRNTILHIKPLEAIYNALIRMGDQPFFN
jgi:hypothetical protein